MDQEGSVSYASGLPPFTLSLADSGTRSVLY